MYENSSIAKTQPILLDLIERHCNGELDDAGYRKLEAILHVNAQARIFMKRLIS